MSEALGAGFTVLCFSAEVADALKDVHAHAGLHVAQFSADGVVATKLGANAMSAYLVRPDMYVGARWHTADVDQIRNGFNTLTFQKGAKP